MPNLTNSMNLLAKHQAAHKAAERHHNKEWNYDTHIALETTYSRIRAQVQNIKAKTTNPRLP
jgi:hypothetical protein